MKGVISMRKFLLCVAILLGSAAPSWAGLILSISNNPDLPQGGTGTAANTYVDVTAVASPGTTVDVTSFSLAFLLQATGTTSTTLQFTNPQGSGFISDPSYIFSSSRTTVQGDPADSTAAEAGTDPIAVDTSSLFAPPYQRATGGDSDFNGNDVEVGSTPVLLARLLLNDLPIGGQAPLVGDTFEVILSSGSYQSSDGSSSDFTSDPIPGGQIVIGPPLAVPEPSSLMLSLIGVAPVAVRWMKRSKAA
jgi:hypothetical protein